MIVHDQTPQEGKRKGRMSLPLSRLDEFVGTLARTPPPTPNVWSEHRGPNGLRGRLPA
jgi:hypothetical protein